MSNGSHFVRFTYLGGDMLWILIPLVAALGWSIGLWSAMTAVTITLGGWCLLVVIWALLIFWMD
jgi:hypothetical protein